MASTGSLTPAGRLHIEASLRGSPMLEHELVRGLTRFAAGRPDWRLISRAPRFTYTAAWLVEHGVDGLIVWNDPPALVAADEAGVPAVSLLPRRGNGHAAVDIDDTAVGRLAAETLLERGFEHFGFCGIGLPWSKTRREAFADVIHQRGQPVRAIDLRFDPAMHESLETEDARRLADWLLALERPAAVFAGLDVAAALVIDVCWDQGLRVPEDVAVLGAGNHEMICEVAPTPIASIDLALDEAGHSACEQLAVMLEGGELSQRQVAVPPRDVVHRRSIEIWAHRDPLVRKAMGLIRERATETIRVGDLAAQLHVSERTLTRRCLASTGRRPGEMARQVRARAAYDMLRRTKLSLAEIAQRSGFADQAHFSREMQRWYAATPATLRFL